MTAVKKIRQTREGSKKIGMQGARKHRKSTSGRSKRVFQRTGDGGPSSPGDNTGAK